MTPRALLTTIGATALTFGVVVGGAAVAPSVGAQETGAATATTTTTTSETTTQGTEANPRAAAYDAFVADLAQQLGSDPATVDAAIRDALKKQVDEREANGQIGKEGAAALKAVIDVSDAPLMLGGPGFGGGERGFRGDHGSMRGPGGDRDGRGWAGGRGPSDKGGAASEKGAAPGGESGGGSGAGEPGSAPAASPTADDTASA